MNNKHQKPPETLIKAQRSLDKSITMDTASRERLQGQLRLWVAGFALLILFTWLGDQLFEHINTTNFIDRLRETNPFFRDVSPILLNSFAFILNWRVARYIIFPLSAIILVMVAASRFVQDVYSLETLKEGFKYVIASITGLFYPILTVDGGKLIIPAGTSNLIDDIGGPGIVVVQPGNAVLFKSVREPTRTAANTRIFLAPFESISQIVNLEDQHDYIPDMASVTRDGIQVKVKDIHYRFRIISEEKNGQQKERTLENPYPYSENALNNMAYNLSVSIDGLTPWHNSVQGQIKGGISDYINDHTIDYLTAPRQDGQDPRHEIRSMMFQPGMVRNLGNLGAELLWIDIGHFDIIEEDVDEKRLDYWAAQWMGNAETARAYGDAKRIAYQEMGRAEAQAELIMSIAQSLEEANIEDNQPANVRKILLSRTAQILDAMGRPKG